MMNQAYQPRGGIMVIGAHAGDAENMGAPTVLKHTRAGYNATIVHLTLGEAGHPTLSAAEYAEQRKREVQESARLMGGKAVWLPYRDGELPVNDDLKFQVCDLIRQEKPTVILTHWKGSFHKDHVATYHIVREAIFLAALPAITRELPAHRISGLYFPENWEDMDEWRADIYLDVTDVWDDYLAVLRSHALMRGDFPTFRYYDYYNALGTIRGCLGGFQKAVALMVPPGSWVKRLEYLPGLEPVS
jgi:LmbE family N-acetylglucosaminyl deacetylase